MSRQNKKQLNDDQNVLVAEKNELLGKLGDKKVMENFSLLMEEIEEMGETLKNGNEETE